MNTTRREFLSVGGTSLIAGGLTLPGFLSRTAAASAPARDDRILVIVQLTGGNDGLNTVIPFANDAYHRARPTLRVAPEAVHRLDDELGLHPEMSGFKQLFDEGALSVVNNIGYPNPDRSHFRSMDIWHCACSEPGQTDVGWLGRVVDMHSAQRQTPLALNLDEGPLPAALRSQTQPTPSIRSLEAFRLRADADALSAMAGAARNNASDDLLYVQRLAVASCASAKRIEEVVAKSDTGGAGGGGIYPDYRLASRLKQIAQLIGAGFGARVYYTSIGGFDTHARQALAHGPLLRELSESITAFHRDLKQRSLSDQVMLMTFSEFGRRVKENGSQGTDHGAAAPMFVIGDSCKAGVIGAAPDLSDLMEGDVRHAIDFRRVYATLLNDWLNIDHVPILGQRYATLNVVG